MKNTLRMHGVNLVCVINSVNQGCTGKTGTQWAIQEISSIVWNMIVHYRVHKWGELSSHHPTLSLWDPHQYHPPIDGQVFLEMSSFQVLQPEPFTHLRAVPWKLKSSPSHCVCTRVTFISTKEPTFTPVGGTGILCFYFTSCCTWLRNWRKPLVTLRLIFVYTVYNTDKIKYWLQIRSLLKLLKYCNEFYKILWQQYH
jgi:hypothetical protein